VTRGDRVTTVTLGKDGAREALTATADGVRAAGETAPVALSTLR